ncbi:MAG: hypothetical protein ACP5NZ_00960 [Nanobdellota archaeon]
MNETEELTYYYGSLKELIKNLNSLKERVNMIKLGIANDKRNSFGYVSPLERDLRELEDERISLLDEFNQITLGINHSQKINLQKLDVESSISQALVRAEGALTMINKKISPLKPEESKQIKEFKENIESLSCSDKLKKNLIYSVNEIKNGDYLGSVLISGRIIDYCLSKLISEAKNEENVISYLAQQGKIPDKKEDRDGAEKSLVKEILTEYNVEKKYRDRTSHNLDFFPQIDVAFRDLHYAIILAEKV